VAAAALRRQGDLESAGWFLSRARELAAGAVLEEARVEAEAGELCAAEGRNAEARQALDRAAEQLLRLGAMKEHERVEARRREVAARLAPRRRAPGEPTFERVLDELLVGAGAPAGALLLLDDHGRPAGRFARGAEITDAAALAALEGGRPIAVAGGVVAPLQLVERAVGVVHVGAAVDEARVAAHAARAALGVENLRFHSGARRRAELRAVLAHEIRNPLAGVLGFSDVLPEEAAEWPPKLVQLMGRIHRDAIKLRTMIEGLLDLVGPRGEAANDVWSATSFAHVDAAWVVSTVARALAGLAALRGVVLETDAVTVDVVIARERVYQALANLVVNAIEASPPGAKVLVSASLDAAAVDAWAAPRGRVKLEVRDEGPGMKAGTLDDHGGLGLRVTKEIARRHQGLVRIEAAPSGGTVASFTVPVARPRTSP
jgi:signal transduction histidine kinase